MSGYGANIVAQWVKLPVVTLTSHMGIPVQIPDALLPVQLPINVERSRWSSRFQVLASLDYCIPIGNEPAEGRYSRACVCTVSRARALFVFQVIK